MYEHRSVDPHLLLGDYLVLVPQTAVPLTEHLLVVEEDAAGLMGTHEVVVGGAGGVAAANCCAQDVTAIASLEGGRGGESEWSE